MRKLKVWILCGGRSAESEVSLVSAKTVWENLSRVHFKLRLIFIDENGKWHQASPRILASSVRARTKTPRGVLLAGNPLKELLDRAARPDVFFPVLHGPMGEDGTMQGLFESLGIPYVGCGVLSSAVSMDKEFTKKLCLERGIPMLPYRVARNAAEARKKAAELRFPVFVKPARLGSSVGVSKAGKTSELEKAIRAAFLYDDKILIERGIAAREIECAVLGDPWSKSGDPLSLKVSGCGEIAVKSGFYDYKKKYFDGAATKLFIPAPISASVSARVQALALKAFQALDGYGMARADFFLDKKTGKIYFNEINTIPGFTASSQYPLLWRHAGLETPRLIDLLIRLALRRHQRRSKLRIRPF